MRWRIANLLLLISFAWSAPAAAHFVITAPTEGATFTAGDSVEIQINILVHHDPGESFDILFIDGSGPAVRARMLLIEGGDEGRVEQIREQDSLWYRIGHQASVSVVAKGLSAQPLYHTEALVCVRKPTAS